MFVHCEEYVESGFSGINHQFKNYGDSIFLGKVDKISYYWVGSNFDVSTQDPAIKAELLEDLPDEIKFQLKQQGYAQNLKLNCSREISKEVGNFDEIFNILLELSEFSIIAVCAILADRSGDCPLSKDSIKDYGQRAKMVLDSIQEGHLLLRANYLDPQTMIREIIPKYTKLQKIYSNEYIIKLKEKGLL